MALQRAASLHVSGTNVQKYQRHVFLHHLTELWSEIVVMFLQ